MKTIKYLSAEQRERIELLCQDLESGVHKQTRGKLYDADTTGFCCLGRACEVFRGQTGRGRWELQADSRYVFVLDKNDGSRSRNTGYLPREVQDWFGFTSSNPFIRDSVHGANSSAFLNDDVRLGFKRIGRAFRRTYLLYTIDD